VGRRVGDKHSSLFGLIIRNKEKVMYHWQQEKYAEDLLTYQEEIKQLKTSLQRKVK
jgi:hypothetical protein